MQNNQTTQLEYSVYAILGLTLMLYLVLRSIYTPILHDEIATFYYYIQTGIYFPPDAHWDANNHILNSMLSNWSFELFGHEPWALRLPNVLSFALFFSFSWKLVQGIKHLGIKWSSFLALVMCHYMFEYFGETRGYGLSMGFLAMGLYYCLKYFKNRNFGWSIAAMISLFLAVSANLTIIYIYLMVLLSLCVSILTQATSLGKKALECGALVLLAAVIVAPLVLFSLELKTRGALYYGGKTSFIDYTVSTLSDLILGSKHPIVIGLILVLSVFVILFVFWKLYENRGHLFKVLLNDKMLFGVLFIGSLVSIFATRYLLDVNFPEDRTALYLYPLLILALAFTIDQVNLKSRILKPLISVLFAYVPVYFIVKIDLSKASFSMDERAPQEYFDLIQEASKKDKFKPTIGGYQTQNLCWYYMNYDAGGRQNSMLFSSFPDTLCDYQILNTRVTLPKNYLLSYEKLNEKPINELNLYRRKQAFKRNLIVEQLSITNWTHQKNEFFNLLEYAELEDAKNKPLLLEISGILHAPSSPFYGRLIISQKDQDWNEISQEGFAFNWLRYDWKDDKRIFRQVLILPNLSEKARHIQVFIWNIQGKPYLIKELDLRLFSLE